MKPVYVFFFATQFKTGAVIRAMTGNTYNHVAFSFEPNTERLYSYSRYRYHEPLLAGFGIEYTDRYIKDRGTTQIKVCELLVSDEQYAEIERRVSAYLSIEKRTMYNYFDLITYPFDHHVELSYTHTCLSFVCEILNIKGIGRIGRLERYLHDSVIYEGSLEGFEQEPSCAPYDFFERRDRRQVYAQSGLALYALTASFLKKHV